MFYLSTHKIPITEPNKQVSNGFLRNILRFYDVLIFVNSDMRGNVTDCARTCSFIYLKILNASKATIVRV